MFYIRSKNDSALFYNCQTLQFDSEGTGFSTYRKASDYNKNKFIRKNTKFSVYEIRNSGVGYIVEKQKIIG